MVSTVTFITISALLLFVNTENSPQGLRLIAFNETYTEWLPQEQIFELALKNTKFMDITDYPTITHKKPKQFAIPTYPTFQAIVNPLLANINTDELLGSLVQLSSFPTRYYTNQNGQQAALFLVEEYQKRSAGRGDISISRYQHPWLQNSVIARIEGSGPKANEIVIIGGHIDSVSSSGNAPGADDDGSGSTAVMEAFRVLATGGFRPERTLEFHGYAAEEAGLLGSQAIANSYANQGVVVYAMIQFDMTGFVRQGTQQTIGLVTDFTSPEVTAFIRELINTYNDISYTNRQCGYACSDHASWFRAGYPSSFPIEAAPGNTNPSIHTSSDTIEKLSPNHISEFVKLGIAFAVELSLAP